MLSDQERLYLQDFLKILDDVRLKSLSSSITMGRICCNSREEAINCILLHSESLISIFNLRKVNSSMLLKYLHAMQIPVPGNATKDDMVKQIFNLWKVSYSPASLCNQSNSASTCIMLPTSQSSLRPSVNNAAQTTQITLADQAFGTNDSLYCSLKQMVNTEKMLKEANAIAFDDFVRQFATIFYDLLNKPDVSTCHQHSLNSSHFFENCEMTIKIISDTEECEVVSDNCTSVLNNLSDLRKQHQILFSPNLSSDGIRGKRNWDGLVYAMACGTIHQHIGIVGHFKQSFVLCTDPFAQSTYKIKESSLILISSKAMPSLSQQMLLPNNEKVNQLALDASSKSQLQITDVS